MFINEYVYREVPCLLYYNTCEVREKISLSARMRYNFLNVVMLCMNFQPLKLIKCQLSCSNKMVILLIHLKHIVRVNGNRISVKPPIQIENNWLILCALLQPCH